VPSIGYLLAGVGVAAAVTFALRAVPFALAARMRGSALLADLGRWMPAGAVIVLAGYCLHGIDLRAAGHGIPQVTAVAATVAVHLWRRNAVISIVVGTACCVALTSWLG
jgi:branched-subunit amino acid transport protein AzlD